MKTFWFYLSTLLILFFSAVAQAVPTITTQPVVLTQVNVGQYIYLYATATSRRTISYQWFKDNVQVAGSKEVKSDGTTHYHIWIAAAQVGNAGTYKIRFSDSSGSVTSRDAVIQVAGTQQAPAPAPTPAPTPAPADSTYISDMSYSVVSNGWGNVTKDRTVENLALKLNGVVYNKGLGVHAHSEVVVNLGGQYSNFMSDVGLDDSAGSPGSVGFQVFADDVKIYDSGTMVGSTATKSINVSVAGKNQLKLIVNSGGNDISDDVADWANARLTSGSQAPAPTPIPTPTPAPSPAPVNAPVITAQPVANTSKVTASSVTVSVGSEYLYIFMEATSSTAMTFKWYRNGVQVGGNEKTLWMNPVQSSDLGEYYVVVSNSSGSVTSNKVSVAAAGSAPSPAPTPIPTPTPAPSPAPAPSAMPQLGGCGQCGDHLADVQKFETMAGRSVDYLLTWGWAQTPEDAMYSFKHIDQEFPRNYKLHFGIPMVIGNGVSGGTFQEVYSGKYDYVFLDLARSMAARDPNMIVRIGHEMNFGGEWGGYPWSMIGPAGNPEEYKMAYRRIVDLCRSVSSGFKFVFNPGAGYHQEGYDWVLAYPGDQWVDIVSFDIYEAGWLAGSYSPADRWKYHLDGGGRGLTFLAQFARDHGKRIAFDEWATEVDDGTFIQNMYNYMRENNVLYQMYWDSNDAFPGKLSDHPVNRAKFKELFGQ